MICLGLEGTAEKTGVGIVDDEGKILASKGKQLIPDSGGIHPREAADHHAASLPQLISEALEEAQLDLNGIDLVAFSKGPGLGPALRTVATAARTLALRLDVPILGVNHCVGHVEIGRLTTGCKDPVTLYVSGGNSQVIAFDSGLYQVFGETLDIAAGNMLDQFSRQTDLGHPGGPRVEELANKSSNYINLPYTVKGMDLAFSGLLTAALRKYEGGESLEDVCFSLQETAFAMLVEVTERALAHSRKKEILLVGGVAANQRLREMVSVMTREHYAQFFIPPMEYCGDNGAMIAWMGQLMHKNGARQDLNNTNIIQRYRTDQVPVPWMKKASELLELPQELAAKGAEANLYQDLYLDHAVMVKKRIPKSYRIKEIDNILRKTRTKGESKLLNEAKRCGVVTPLVYDINIKESTITMEKMDGNLVKDVIDDSKLDEITTICNKIGESIARLHHCGIIHGDLTTSNLLLNGDKIIFIDFGLGKISQLTEDKGVDLLVFKKALSGIHHEISGECFAAILEGYQDAEDYQLVVDKVREIEGRGRYTVIESS
ncbi:bifunctional N(6)-L-threonylcarbamoyladenine synthase/serine/threonine protein kinase [Methanobacterium sp. CWC-01]|uniref:bifunctional N(6)-L-threonylcarbamoyladenine synthase/serine/threonine protein kinase n=1 Tax=Methanobacterium aridiramus TaxID=2584467 RepID=UPI002579043A|nr:bifunctional N(6)-L-threonylcarbamoyladenine synthase/serine/threonine protein kinase [Methanobacterium sp. CWC-01]WJI09501.1 bifunctional N(6)-L-threonylcarbamoyladenine synthase/serine/threonine protein kinase [Methanobacterium sp. CWC-01]